jgi:3-phenylpropionate/trans-cinnamate dioxygenase ferredoxin subunit
MSNPWINVLSTQEVPAGTYKVIQVAFRSIIIVNNANRYFAIENLCTHDGGDLEGCSIEGEEIICPRHGAGFCMKTGEVTRPPAYESIQAFPIRVEGDHIQIQVS